MRIKKETETKLIRIADAFLIPNRSTRFKYLINGSIKEVLGVLATNNTEVSISFENGKELDINSFNNQLDDLMNLSPNKRVLEWNRQLTDSRVLVGSITNVGTIAKPINLYLITR